jgi:hypothetical protein
MEFLSQLWMPILLSAVFVWFSSFILHMLLPMHKGECSGVPDEAKLNAALEGVAPGMYMFPWCGTTMAEMKSPEYEEKQRVGPNGVLTVWPGPTQMGRNMVLTLLFYLVVGVFVAYVASHALPVGTPYLKVFQIAGAVAFMAHGLGWMPNMIWYGGSTRSFWTYLIDSIVYALLTAGTFAWLWPK